MISTIDFTKKFLHKAKEKCNGDLICLYKELLILELITGITLEEVLKFID